MASICSNTGHAKASMKLLALLKNNINKMKKEDVSYISAHLIKAFSSNTIPYFAEAMELMQLLESCSVEFDPYIYTQLFKLCTEVKNLEAGKRIHTHLLKSGVQANTFVRNSLLNMYAKCGDFTTAMALFKEHCKSNEANEVTCNSLLSAFVSHGKHLEALDLYKDMDNLGFNPTSVSYACALQACGMTGNLAFGKQIHAEIVQRKILLTGGLKQALLNMYITCGNFPAAVSFFNELRNKNALTLELYTTMIGASSKQETEFDGLSLFKELQDKGFKPDIQTYTVALIACNESVALQQGKKIHAAVLQQGLKLDIPIISSLMTMYARCGDLATTCSIFEDTLQEGIQNVTVWTSMIAA
jgi:pentatricopeptide repeat protein